MVQSILAIIVYFCSLNKILIMSLFEKHKEKLNRAIQALEERKIWAAYPEHPKAYGEDYSLKGQTAYNIHLEKPYNALLQKYPCA